MGSRDLTHLFCSKHIKLNITFLLHFIKETKWAHSDKFCIFLNVGQKNFLFKMIIKYQREKWRGKLWMVEKKVVGEGRLPPWEIAQPHPGRRETHHNQGWKLQFLSKSETGKEEPNISGKQFWFAFSQPLRRVRAPLGAVLVTVTLSLVPKQIINSILIIMNFQT